MKIHSRPYYLTVINGLNTQTYHFKVLEDGADVLEMFRRRNPNATFVTNLPDPQPQTDREWYPV